MPARELLRLGPSWSLEESSTVCKCKYSHSEWYPACKMQLGQEVFGKYSCYHFAYWHKRNDCEIKQDAIKVQTFSLKVQLVITAQCRLAHHQWCEGEELAPRLGPEYSPWQASPRSCGMRDELGRIWESESQNRWINDLWFWERRDTSSGWLMWLGLWRQLLSWEPKFPICLYAADDLMRDTLALDHTPQLLRIIAAVDEIVTLGSVSNKRRLVSNHTGTEKGQSKIRAACCYVCIQPTTAILTNSRDLGRFDSGSQYVHLSQDGNQKLDWLLLQSASKKLHKALPRTGAPTQKECSKGNHGLKKTPSLFLCRWQHKQREKKNPKYLSEQMYSR